MQFGDILKNRSVFWSKLCILGSNYAIRQNSEKLLRSHPRHSGVFDWLTIVPEIFQCKKSLLGTKYAIWRDSEKSVSGGQRHLTVADRPPTPIDNTKSASPCEPLLSPIFVGAWSHIRLGLVQIDIWARQTDGQTCAKYNQDYN